MVIDVLVVDLIPANPIELFGNRAQANTNRSGAERLIIFSFLATIVIQSWAENNGISAIFERNSGLKF